MTQVDTEIAQKNLHCKVFDANKMVNAILSCLDNKDDIIISISVNSSTMFINCDDSTSTVVPDDERITLLSNGTYRYVGPGKDAISWIERIKKEDKQYNKTDDYVQCGTNIKIYKNINKGYTPKGMFENGTTIDKDGYYPVDGHFMKMCSKQMKREKGGFDEEYCPAPILYIKHNDNAKGFINIGLEQLFDLY
jgi:archaellum component FlaF (FlaF/FlaG flagellin family)